MARIRKPFTLLKRVSTAGTVCYYYRVYDQEGRRREFSTGHSAKTRAEAYCLDLFREGKLLPVVEESKIPRFEDYAKGFWKVDGDYYNSCKLLGKTLSPEHIGNMESITRLRLIPSFGDKRLDEITSQMVKNWRLQLLRTGMKVSTAHHGKTKGQTVDKKISETMIVKAVKCLKLMMSFAVEQEILAINPIEKLKAAHPKGTMRDQYGIYHLSQSLKYNGKLGSTKSGDERFPTIPKSLWDELKKEFPHCKGFVFSEDGGKSPVTQAMVNRPFTRVLKVLQIKREEVTFHSLRHFFNTHLVAQGVASGKIRSFVGHKSQKVNDGYTHLGPEHFEEIRLAQEKLVTQIQGTEGEGS